MAVEGKKVQKGIFEFNENEMRTSTDGIKFVKNLHKSFKGSVLAAANRECGFSEGTIPNHRVRD